MRNTHGPAFALHALLIQRTACLGLLPQRSALTALIMASAGILLVGCATSADPHQGGFVSGVVGIAGGGYERRVEERERLYEDEVDAQQRLTAEAQALKAERAAVRAELSRAQARLAAQERRIAQERARIEAARQRSEADRLRLQRLNQAQAHINSAKLALSDVKLNDQPVSDLKARSREIGLELDEIDSMIGVVSGT